MNHIHSRRFLVLFTILLALFAALVAPASATVSGPVSAPGGQTGSAAPLPGLAPGSCHDIRTSFPFAPDGLYPVLAGNTLLTVFCYDMSGTPRDYVDLAHIGGNVNFSQYTAGGASPGSDVRTSFSKLRIDPATLTVDIGDLTFASTTGRLQHSSVTRGPSSPFVTGMPYATAMSCTGRQDDGAANINLRGTPFVVDDTFEPQSFGGGGSATVSPDEQTVDLAGGGYCGWIWPAPQSAASPFNPAPGDFRLNLACAPASLQPTQPRQYCIKLS